MNGENMGFLTPRWLFDSAQRYMEANKEKKLKAEVFKVTRDLVNFVNGENLGKEDILTILVQNGQIVLLYFK